ncbi:MAG: hypothetical protein BWX47_02023 [candidate division Hyd24-12 bacterium ADurb.Bin004]|nr:MAG: hypothetical protein BWX47_02023 [candidate division Hyd24-12 bacterium ADurb.Bin004]
MDGGLLERRLAGRIRPGLPGRRGRLHRFRRLGRGRHRRRPGRDRFRRPRVVPDGCRNGFAFPTRLGFDGRRPGRDRSRYGRGRPDEGARSRRGLYPGAGGAGWHTHGRGGLRRSRGAAGFDNRSERILPPRLHASRERTPPLGRLSRRAGPGRRILAKLPGGRRHVPPAGLAAGIVGDGRFRRVRLQEDDRGRFHQRGGAEEARADRGGEGRLRSGSKMLQAARRGRSGVLVGLRGTGLVLRSGRQHGARAGLVSGRAGDRPRLRLGRLQARAPGPGRGPPGFRPDLVPHGTRDRSVHRRGVGQPGAPR